ncbi:Predicted nuclease of restriction endonuclease-like (RecB) superfamily, DUF1016 family [Pseudobutyrivibrio sp. 49]|uniref:PDDEXK nuclease domain-containing protein n=1 Tax=Pseudobutyrivibrio sp. 49 TaxID=1855344 RepID=UPI00088760E6|nr:PDDEXK nuclease domain-containing protein [Pseudobutyrivibrio sp. 49]SDH69794.1 Predicted nuclease of restriction endonuclease-like (RecB) superfamily, DUF1016 family [Pseudobutyrivibrio sp. 49]
MAEIIPNEDKEYSVLLDKIGQRIDQGKQEVARALIKSMLGTYWDMGQYIVEYEQDGKPHAIYGQQLFKRLSKDLTLRYGKGYSVPNLYNMRQFYQVYKDGYEELLSLTWSHVCILMRIENPVEREFYQRQCIDEKWDVTSLNRQKKSALFLRLADNKDKNEIIKLAREGIVIEKPEDVVKDVYTLDFMNLPSNIVIDETELEGRLMKQLGFFFLELGKGFTFVGEQYPMRINNKTFKCDLVFYHRILKCFFLVDLKIDEVEHKDIGQMNMYMGYFAEEVNEPDDKPPVGLILAREKDELMVKYATYGMDTNLFVSKYELYLPDENELRKLVEKALNDDTEIEN